MPTRTPEDDTRAWYESWFDRAEYELVYGHRDESEATRLIDLIERVIAPPPGSRILDVGCGRGRHAVQFAKRGYDVTGVDLSSNAIEAARRLARDRGVEATFVVGDMRDALCRGCFDLVVNLFTAFGYFDDDAENDAALDAMATATKPNGWIVQDFLNAENVRRSLVPFDSRNADGVRISQQRRIVDSRIEKTITLTNEAGTHAFTESVRLLTIEEFDRMHRKAGALLTRVFGNYTGGPFRPDSPRLLMFSKKTA